MSTKAELEFLDYVQDEAEPMAMKPRPSWEWIVESSCSCRW